jgi:hypothetical protein
MPRAFDQQQIAIDRNPLQGLTQDWGKLPKLNPIDPAGVIELWVGYIKDITGIDLTGIVDFVDWLGEQIGINPLSEFGAVWQDLLDGIAGVFAPLEEGFNAVVADVVAAIDGIFKTGKDAKLSADNANITVQALKALLAGGGSDEFDYENANTLPSALYEVSTGGAGAGNYGPNGAGFLVWKPSGAGVREIIYRRIDTTLLEDDMVITSVWAEKPYDVLLPKTFGYICGRMSLVSNNTHVRAKISDDDACIEAVVSGTATQIGTTKSLKVTAGDVFELWLGYKHPTDPLLDHPRRFWLKQNGVTVLTVDDGAADGTGSVSEMGGSYRQAGIGARVDNYLILFQNPAPSLAGWTWSPQPTGGS